MEGPHTRVGIAVFVFKDGKFLMGKRRNSHGAGTWTVPGGHLEFGESFEETAAREVLEETNVTIKDIRFGALTNDMFEPEHKHYTCIWMTSDYESGTATLMEPDRCIEWQWCDFDSLPTPLFSPAWEHLLASEFITEIKRRAVESKHA